MTVLGWQWVLLGAGLALAVVFALGLGPLVHPFALNLARRTRVTWDELLVLEFSRPVRFLVALCIFTAVGRSLGLAEPAREVVDQVIRILAVVVFSWLGVRTIGFGAKVLTERASAHGGDLAARSRLTHIAVMKRVAGIVVVVVGGALVLLQFDAFRALGTSMLASAGVAGIVIGFAAQKSIGMILAGLQISVTQPLRVGDVVVIEGEWGTIEEVTLTFVVVRIWDLRRLVVPVTKILETTFQNWSRAGSEIIGTVFLHADYRLPIEVVRTELERYVASRKEWDGKVVAVQVTEATDRTVQLRALVSSADPGSAWDLRCAVREHLISFVQRLEGGVYLPVTRVASPASVALSTAPLASGSVDGARDGPHSRATPSRPERTP
jgi:small-conductance mechanosensitive channel